MRWTKDPCLQMDLAEAKRAQENDPEMMEEASPVLVPHSLRPSLARPSLYPPNLNPLTTMVDEVARAVEGGEEEKVRG